MYKDFSDKVTEATGEIKKTAVAAVKSAVDVVKTKIASLGDAVKGKLKEWFGWRFKKNIKNLRLKKFKVNSKAKLQ